MMPATTALSPVAWAVSELTVLRMIEMTNKMTNPMNEKNIPRPITFAARMFYSWALQRRVNAQTSYRVKITCNECRHSLRNARLDWGHRVSDLGKEQLDLCYPEFQKHCMRRHGLQEWDTTASMKLDLEHWMLTLIKS
jgi:hypothetical protein